MKPGDMLFLNRQYRVDPDNPQFFILCISVVEDEVFVLQTWFKDSTTNLQSTTPKALDNFYHKAIT